jgi:hypothetical protein
MTILLVLLISSARDYRIVTKHILPDFRSDGGISSSNQIYNTFCPEEMIKKAVNIQSQNKMNRLGTLASGSKKRNLEDVACNQV